MSADINITKEKIEQISRVARLNLTDSEKEEFRRELDNILEAFKVMDEVDTDDIEPSFQPVMIKDVMRDDVLKKSLTQNEALSNTRHKDKGFFRGPRVV